MKAEAERSQEKAQGERTGQLLLICCNSEPRLYGFYQFREFSVKTNGCASVLIFCEWIHPSLHDSGPQDGNLEADQRMRPVSVMPLRLH